jgi:hypothetical protein
MGGIYPPDYPFWFVDHHLDDIAQMLGRYVFADVAIDTSARQETPEKPWTQGKRDTWLWAWLFDATRGERQEIARSIIAEMDETPARKAALLNDFPVIAQHSEMVNGWARQDLGTYQPPDPWYDKVRENGVARLRQVLSAEEFAEFQRVDGEIKRQVAEMTSAEMTKEAA